MAKNGLKYRPAPSEGLVYLWLQIGKMKVYYSLDETDDEQQNIKAYNFLKVAKIVFTAHMKPLEKEIDENGVFFVIKITQPLDGCIEYYNAFGELRTKIDLLMDDFEKNGYFAKVLRNLPPKAQ